MFAEVVLHRRIPSRFDSFTYEVPNGMNVLPGQIVQVPFRRQILPAIVRTLHGQKPSYPTKLLTEAVSFVLPQRQVELANWMCERYACSFSKVIDLFIPEKIWQPTKRAPAREKEADMRKKTSTPSTALQTFTAQLLECQTKKLIVEKTIFPREEFYALLSKIQAPKGQTLFLFPEFFHAQQIAQHLPIFHGGLKETEKAELWEAVRNGELSTLAGTRAALFLPFKNLSLIVIDFEHDESYREIRQPNYHALEVAEQLATMWNIPLLMISSTPRVETWYAATQKKYEQTEWNEVKKIAPVEVINLADERHRGNFDLLSSAVVEKMAARLSQNEQILLFLNRTGEASALLCPDCGKVFRCAKCKTPLTLHKTLELKCHRCALREPMPAQCDVCGNINFKQLGAGTERLEKEIQNIFAKAKILRLDRETLAPKAKRVVLANPKNLEQADILITTQFIDKPFHLPKLTLSVAVLPDPLLHFPNFQATERVFQLLTHIRLLTNPKGTTVIQTFLPRHKLFEYLEKNLIESFYEDELTVRKSLNLPPFS